MAVIGLHLPATGLEHIIDPAIVLGQRRGGPGSSTAQTVQFPTILP